MTKPTSDPKINWEPLDEFPEHLCLCHCGVNFYSHAKYCLTVRPYGLFSRKPCPGCGRKDNLRGARVRLDSQVLKK